MVDATGSTPTLALVDLPPGMSADNRYTWWKEQPLPPLTITPGLFHSSGSINCGGATKLGYYFSIAGHFYGLAIASADGSGEASYLC